MDSLARSLAAVGYCNLLYLRARSGMENALLNPVFNLRACSAAFKGIDCKEHARSQPCLIGIRAAARQRRLLAAQCTGARAVAQLRKKALQQLGTLILKHARCHFKAMIETIVAT